MPEFGDVGGPHDRAVAAQPAGPPHRLGDVPDVGDLGVSVEMGQNCRGVLGDESLGVRAEQHGDAGVRERVRGHQAAVPSADSGMATTMCAFVPLMPKADTAAIRRPRTAGHGTCLVASRNP